MSDMEDVKGEVHNLNVSGTEFSKDMEKVQCELGVVCEDNNRMVFNLKQLQQDLQQAEEDKVSTSL